MDRPVLIGYKSRGEAAHALAAELTSQGRTAVAKAVEVLDADSVNEFLAAAAKLGEGLGAVVSASGSHFPMCSLTDASVDEFRRVVDIELIGTFNILKGAVAALKRAGGGSILVFLTTAVLRTMEYDGLNSVPKAGIAMMLKHVAREAGRDNIRANGIAPGVIDAGLTLSVSQMPQLVQKVVADCLANTPLGRAGKPCEVGEVANFLISEHAGYINGQILGVDGGWSV